MLHNLQSYFRQNWFSILAFALIVGGVYFFFIRKPRREVSLPSRNEELELVTLLPRDAIPAIDNPRFYSGAEADAEYDPDELVMGVSLNGDSRAYSTGKLSGHEIVNDVVGGRPISVTW